MAKFIKIQMTDKKEFPKQVPINFDQVVSLTPHLTDDNRYILCFDRGGQFDVIIPDETMRRILWE